MGRQSGLGRGLGALIPPKPPAMQGRPQHISQPIPPQSIVEDSAPLAVEEVAPVKTGLRDYHDAGIAMLSVNSIDPNPHQPRTHFDHNQLEDLIASIQEHGILQPIVVTTSSNGRYELISGERRLRASKISGRDTIPAIVRSATDQQKLELALIENIQRQNLNPLEEAEAYLRLQNEFNLTQDEVGKRVGKSRPQVANTMRLLQLPDEIKQAISQGTISSSNARTLLSIQSEEERMKLFQAMLDGNFTVRQTEARVPHRQSRRQQQPGMFDANILDAERKLREVLGTKVIIKRDSRGEGEIRITFLNEEDCGNIVKKISGES